MRQIAISRPTAPPAGLPAVFDVDSAVRSERLRCARDVHDIMLQDLTAVLLQLRAACRSADQASHSAHLDNAMHAAEQGLASARDFVRRLRGPAGQAPAKAAVTTSLARAVDGAVRNLPLAAGLALQLDLAQDAALPAATCEQLAMIVREAAGNAAKHARAATIRCTLRVRANSVQVTVADDGTGYDTHACRRGFGIGGMHERAALAGAALTIASAPGRGTTVFLSLPLDAGE